MRSLNCVKSWMSLALWIFEIIIEHWWNECFVGGIAPAT